MFEFKAGDRVYAIGTGETGEVVSIDGTKVRVKVFGRKKETPVTWESYFLIPENQKDDYLNHLRRVFKVDD